MSVTVLNPIREYIDVDFAFLQHPITQNVTIKKDYNAIKQSVINLLTIKKYDKPFHPEIAPPIEFHLFENYSFLSNIVLSDEIKIYLNLFEPRLNITEVEISSPAPNYINCSIIGIIKNTSQPFTIDVLVNRLR